MLTYLLIAIEGSFVRAGGQGQTVNPPQVPAVMLLQKDGTYDFHGQVVRCRPDEHVGIRAESRTHLTIANVVVEGCEVGIMVTGGASTDGPGDGALGVTQLSSVHVEGVTVRVTTIGILLGGSGGTVSNNFVGEARYGIVVTGDDYSITENQSNDNIQDGFLVTGDRNLLEGNEALRNGGIGIHVARMVPMVMNKRFLPFIQDRGVGNVIRGNTALDNKHDLVEFANCADPPFPPLANEWINNIFKTRRPQCIK